MYSSETEIAVVSQEDFIQIEGGSIGVVIAKRAFLLQMEVSSKLLYLLKPRNTKGGSNTYR